LLCLGYVGTRPRMAAAANCSKKINHIPLIGLFTGSMSLRQPCQPDYHSINPARQLDDRGGSSRRRHFVNKGGQECSAIFHQGGWVFGIRRGFPGDREGFEGRAGGCPFLREGRFCGANTWPPRRACRPYCLRPLPMVVIFMVGALKHGRLAGPFGQKQARGLMDSKGRKPWGRFRLLGNRKTFLLNGPLGAVGADGCRHSSGSYPFPGRS